MGMVDFKGEVESKLNRNRLFEENEYKFKRKNANMLNRESGNNTVIVEKGITAEEANKYYYNEDYELIRNIQEAIKAHHKDVKVWNLSISITVPVDEFNFSDFAIALDALQDKYNVLICKSAGNCRNFTTGHPKGKIHQGADSVRSIVVGSIAHKKSTTDLAEIDNPSPFTRIGRGPSFIIKPIFVT